MKKLLLLFFTTFFFLFPSLTFADVTVDVAVSAAVNPHPSDFQLSIDSNPNSATTVNQFQNIVYTITYGSHLPYATPITIVGSWDQGTIQGQGSPSVDIVDYVVGSAGNAYGNTPPVVDTANRKITWTISSLPANTTNQTVSFTLQTNASYTGAQTVTFPTTAHLSVNNVTIPDQSVTMTYQYNPAITPSPTPTPIVTPTSAITNTPTPGSGGNSPTNTPTPFINAGTTTPTPTMINNPQTSLTITGVSIENLSSTQATIRVKTNLPATISLQYGTSIQLLNMNQPGSFGIEQLLHLINLQPNTQYYFRIIAKGNNQTLTSELFTFKTSSVAQTQQIEPTSVIITSEKILLYDPIENAKGQLKNTAVIPINTPYEFTFALRDKNQVKHIQAFIRNNQVLGINNFTDIPPTDNVILFETQPGVYQGRLTTNSIAGSYGLYARVFDTNGNIGEEKIVSIKTVNPFTIYDHQTKKPLEHAQVSLSRLDEQTHQFIKITTNMLAMQNPDFSNMQGELPFVLPQGTYQAVITAIGYKGQTIVFKLGASTGENYPMVYLEKSLFSFWNIINFFDTTFKDILNLTNNYFGNIGSSQRFFSFFSAIASLIFLILSFFALSLRIHIPIYLLPWYIWYRVKRLLQNKKENEVLCRVIDEDTNLHIAQGEVTVIDAEKNKIVMKQKTNAVGEFSFITTDCPLYKIAVVKKGYEGHPFFEFSQESLRHGIVMLPIKKSEMKPTLVMKFLHGCKYIVSLYFELFLIVTFLLEVLFGIYLGLQLVMPFLTISFINASIWLLHMHTNK